MSEYEGTMPGWHGEPMELVGYLSRSTCRMTILKSLLERDPRSREELRNGTDCVRTTVQRNLEALQDRGLVSAEERSYRLTEHGRIITKGMLGAEAAVDLAARLRPVLESLPAGDPPIDWMDLEDVTVIQSTRTDPYAPVDRYKEAISGAKTVWTAFPLGDQRLIEHTLRSASDGTSHEVLLTEAVASNLEKDGDLFGLLEDLVKTGNADIGLLTLDLPYYLGVIDDSIQVGVHSESGIPKALLETSDDGVYEWACDQFAAYASEAEPFGRSTV